MARFYDPTIAHFVQADSIIPEAGSSKGYDRYGFVNWNPIRYSDPSGYMAWQGEGGSDTKEQIAYDAKRLENLKCQAGNTSYCSYGEQHPAELAGFVVGSWVGLAAAEIFILEGGAASIADTVVTRAGIACLKSAVCRGLVGAAGGAGVTQLPKRLARVIPVDVFTETETLGPQNVTDVFVTSADDIVGISTSQGIAKTLSLYNLSGGYVRGPFAVLEFDAVEGIAIPILRSNPGFVGGGYTIGGAQEYVISNLEINILKNLIVRILQ